MNEHGTSMTEAEEVPFGYDTPPCKLTAKGRVVPCSSADEYAEWTRETPELWLFRTSMADAVVETVFDGKHGIDRCFWSYLVEGEERRTLQRWKNEGMNLTFAEEQHERAIHEAAQDWFSAASFPNPPRSASAREGQPLRGTTIRSLLCGHLALAEPSVTAVEPPRRMQSLRYRLMKRLRLRPAHWYEIQYAIATAEKRGLSVMERAWKDGLLCRIEGATKIDPPRFGLSAKAITLFDEGRLTECEQGIEDWSADVWVPGWEPWRSYFCPLCGAAGTKSVTMRGNIRVYCSRAGWIEDSAKCPGRWFIVLRDGRPAIEKCVRGDAGVGIDHMRKRTYLFVGEHTKKEVRRVLSYDEIREKIRTYSVFS